MFTLFMYRRIFGFIQISAIFKTVGWILANLNGCSYQRVCRRNDRFIDRSQNDTNCTYFGGSGHTEQIGYNTD